MISPDKQPSRHQAILIAAAAALALIALIVLGIPQWAYEEFVVLENDADVQSSPFDGASRNYYPLKGDPAHGIPPARGPNGEKCNPDLPPLAPGAPDSLVQAAAQGQPTSQIPCVPIIRNTQP